MLKFSAACGVRSMMYVQCFSHLAIFDLQTIADLTMRQSNFHLYTVYYDFKYKTNFIDRNNLKVLVICDLAVRRRNDASVISSTILYRPGLCHIAPSRLCLRGDSNCIVKDGILTLNCIQCCDEQKIRFLILTLLIMMPLLQQLSKKMTGVVRSKLKNESIELLAKKVLQKTQKVLRLSDIVESTTLFIIKNLNIFFRKVLLWRKYYLLKKVLPPLYINPT